MLSSKHTRFAWSKQDRTPEMSLFRILCGQWRPTTRVVRDAQPIDVLRAAALEKKKRKQVKPVWTPWLWVDGG